MYRTDYRRAIELNPSFEDAYAARTMTLAGLNRLQEARAALERALELDPLNARASSLLQIRALSRLFSDYAARDVRLERRFRCTRRVSARVRCYRRSVTRTRRLARNPTTGGAVRSSAPTSTPRAPSACVARCASATSRSNRFCSW